MGRDDGDRFAFSRQVCPSFASSFALRENQRAQGRPGARRTRGLACRFAHRKRLHTSIQVWRKHPGLPCAMVLRFASCSSRRTAVLPPSPARLHAGLTPAPRRQNHTTSPYASGVSVHHAFRVHRIPPRVRDDGQRPSYRSETGGVMPVIWPRTEAEYFRAEGLTRFLKIRSDLPRSQIVARISSCDMRDRRLRHPAYRKSSCGLRFHLTLHESKMPPASLHLSAAPRTAAIRHRGWT
jgi:hypothetical protein